MTTYSREHLANCLTCSPKPTIETQLQNIAATTALLARQLDLHDKAQTLIEDVFGPNCALCGQRSRSSFRTDTNVHSDCWRREKADDLDRDE